MAGSAASESILFIGAILATTAVVGALVPVIQELSGDLRDRGRTTGDRLASDISIINDAEAMATSPLVVYVKNTGQTSLVVTDFTFLLDGQVSTNTTYDVLDASDDTTLHPAQVLQATVNDLSVTVGDHRIRAVAGTGADAGLTFYEAGP
ncbi:MAG: hypothetical protein ACPGQL_05075 [Thermoplasmatota archaeon]